MTQNTITSEKTLADVMYDIWRAKFYILFFMVTGTICAALFVSFAQNHYRAHMIIAPATPLGVGSSSSPQNNEGTIQTQRSETQSNAALLRFAHLYDTPTVAAILMQDQSIIDALAFDRRFEFSKPHTQWDAQKLSEYIQKRVKLETVSGTNLRKMTYLHPHREFATAFIERIYNITDHIIRTDHLKRVNAQLIYLENALSQTQHPDHRRNLAALLMEQERMKMFLSINQPFSAEIVTPAHSNSKPSWPDPYLIYGAFMLIGCFLGYVVYGLRHNA